MPSSALALLVCVAGWQLGFTAAFSRGFAAGAATTARTGRVRSRAVCTEPSDDELLASLRERISQVESTDSLPTLGPDDIDCLSMGPSDVIDYVMRGLVLGRFDVLLGFAAAVDETDQLDHVGQVQPGAFRDPEALAAFFRGHERYNVLAEGLAEFKPMGGVDLSDLSRRGVQKLLVRSGGNWREVYINLQLTPHLESSKRWVITSMHMSGN